MADNLRKLVDLMARLRGPDGCPWDRKQTTESLKPFLIEETYEVIDALDERDPEKIKEELGDLLFQIIFHAQLAREQGDFTIEDVIAANVEKMVRRHPHVFGTEKAETAAEVLANWEEIKKKEKGHDQRKSILEGVPRSMPSLIRAHKLQEKVAKVGFDWNRIDEALPKLDEEIAEFKESLRSENAGKNRGGIRRYPIYARKPFPLPPGGSRTSSSQDHQQVHPQVQAYRGKRGRCREKPEGYDPGRDGETVARG